MKEMNNPIRNQIIDVIRYHTPETAYEILNGYHVNEIGFNDVGSNTNPVLLVGQPSVDKWFSQLHTLDGEPVEYHKIKTSFSPVSPKPCEVYHVSNKSISKEIWVCIFAKRQTNLCPPELMIKHQG